MKLFKPQIPKRSLDYVVTGTGRCGTVYMARLLTSLGFPCTHEAVFTPTGIRRDSIVKKVYVVGRENWFPINQNPDVWVTKQDKVVAESSYLAAPYLAELDSSKVIHIVRNPVDTISSLLQEFIYFRERPNSDSSVYHKFIYEHVPSLNQDLDPILRTCLFYVEWNELIERQKPDLLYPVESDVKVLMDFLGVDKNSYYTNRRCNIGGSRKTLTQIPEGKIKDRLIAMAERYGYTINI